MMQIYCQVIVHSIYHKNAFLMDATDKREAQESVLLSR